MRRLHRLHRLGAVLALAVLVTSPGLAGGEPAAAPPAAGGVYPTGTITGRVTDAATGRPIPGVEVLIWQVDSVVTSRTTGRDGRYRAVVPATGEFAGEYYVSTVNDAGYVDEAYDDQLCAGYLCVPPFDTPIVVPAGGTVGGIDFALARGGAVSGTVRAAASGEPVTGLSVLITAHGSGPAFLTPVRANGSFRVSGLPPGRYRIRTLGARDVGLADQLYAGVGCGLIVCDDQQATLVRVRAGREVAGVELDLEALGSIAGTVTETGTGEPVAGLHLLFRDAFGFFEFATTGVDGRYGAPLPPGPYTLRTYSFAARQLWLIDELYDDLPCYQALCDLDDGTPVVVEAGATAAGTDFAVDRGGTLTGRVTRESDGEPLPAWIDVFDERYFVRTALADADGRYALEGLPAGPYYPVTNSILYRDEVHGGLQCLRGTALGCDPHDGTPAVLELGGAAEVDFALADGFRPGVPCRQTASNACAGGGRYRIGVQSAVWPEYRFARGIPIGDLAAAFTFHAPDNVEAVVKLLDACAPFGRTWVFSAGLTRLPTEVGVLDTATGDHRLYTLESLYRPDRSPLVQPRLDTTGFACAAPVGAGEAEVAIPAPLTSDNRVAARIAPPVATPAAPAVAGECAPAPTRLCLNSGRFSVEAEWSDVGGGGAAGAVALGDRSGYFWFGRPGNPEVAVKVLGGCDPEPRGFQLFAAGLTRRQVRVTVTDTATGDSREYENPAGRRFEPVFDHFEGCS